MYLDYLLTMYVYLYSYLQGFTVRGSSPPSGSGALYPALCVGGAALAAAAAVALAVARRRDRAPSAQGFVQVITYLAIDIDRIIVNLFFFVCRYIHTLIYAKFIGNLPLICCLKYFSKKNLF